MKIVVLSATDQPTLKDGPNGLGRMAWDIATQLHKRGHEVTLMAGPGSEWDDMGTLNITRNETWRAENWDAHRVTFEAAIDVSHFHDLSRLHPDMPVINWVADTEIQYQPPNLVVGNTWQQNKFSDAESRIVRLGIDVDAIPFAPTPAAAPYVAFVGKIHTAKGPDIAVEAARLAGVEIRFIGTNYMGIELPNWRDAITDNAELWAFMGSAIALLAPSRIDSGGRGVLEAQACGTPVITTDTTGVQYHVSHAVSGFVCKDAVEMAEAIKDARKLDRAQVRAWVKQTHDMPVMIDALEYFCQRVGLDGLRW